MRRRRTKNIAIDAALAREKVEGAWRTQAARHDAEEDEKGERRQERRERDHFAHGARRYEMSFEWKKDADVMIECKRK